MRALLDNEKERAKHRMLIDLERNDLGCVCRGETVRVGQYMGIETYAHVHHIVSNIRGELRADCTHRDGSCDFNILIRTITVSGTSPQFRAGAGIVTDSITSQELDETRAKAKLSAVRGTA